MARVRVHRSGLRTVFLALGRQRSSMGEAIGQVAAIQPFGPLKTTRQSKRLATKNST